MLCLAIGPRAAGGGIDETGVVRGEEGLVVEGLVYHCWLCE